VSAGVSERPIRSRRASERTGYGYGISQFRYPGERNHGPARASNTGEGPLVSHRFA